MLADLGAGREPDSRALATVDEALRAYARRVFRDLDADDVVQNMLTRLVQNKERLAGADIDSAWAYLIGATRNAALDAIRARSRRPEAGSDTLPEQAAPEDAIAALVDRNATHAAVVHAQKTLIEAGDDLVVPIITVWLDLADALGEAPSTREVAGHTGVSHTTVADALKRFRRTLEEGA